MKRLIPIAAAMGLGLAGAARAGIHDASPSLAESSILDQESIASVGNSYLWDVDRSAPTVAVVAPRQAAFSAPAPSFLPGPAIVKTFAINPANPVHHPQHLLAAVGSAPGPLQAPIAVPLPPAAPAGFAMLSLLALVRLLKRVVRQH